MNLSTGLGQVPTLDNLQRELVVKLVVLFEYRNEMLLYGIHRGVIRIVGYASQVYIQGVLTKHRYQN